QAKRAAEAGQRLDAGLVRPQPGKTGAGDLAELAHLPEHALGFGERDPARLRHEARDLASVESVGVERDVDAAGPVQRPLDRPLAGVELARRDELLLGRVEVARAEEGGVLRLNRARVE